VKNLKALGRPEQAIQGAATFCVAIAQGEFPAKNRVMRPTQVIYTDYFLDYSGYHTY
jgi:hypothetical protein